MFSYQAPGAWESCVQLPSAGGGMDPSHETQPGRPVHLFPTIVSSTMMQARNRCTDVTKVLFLGHLCGRGMLGATIIRPWSAGTGFPSARWSAGTMEEFCLTPPPQRNQDHVVKYGWEFAGCCGFAHGGNPHDPQPQGGGCWASMDRGGCGGPGNQKAGCLHAPLLRGEIRVQGERKTVTV